MPVLDQPADQADDFGNMFRRSGMYSRRTDSERAGILGVRDGLNGQAVDIREYLLPQRALCSA